MTMNERRRKYYSWSATHRTRLLVQVVSVSFRTVPQTLFRSSSLDVHLCSPTTNVTKDCRPVVIVDPRRRNIHERGELRTFPVFFRNFYRIYIRHWSDRILCENAPLPQQ